MNFSSRSKPTLPLETVEAGAVRIMRRSANSVTETPLLLDRDTEIGLHGPRRGTPERRIVLWLLIRGYVSRGPDKRYRVTPAGQAWIRGVIAAETHQNQTPPEVAPVTSETPPETPPEAVQEAVLPIVESPQIEGGTS